MIPFAYCHESHTMFVNLAHIPYQHQHGRQLGTQKVPTKVKVMIHMAILKTAVIWKESLSVP